SVPFAAGQADCKTGYRLSVVQALPRCRWIAVARWLAWFALCLFSPSCEPFPTSEQVLQVRLLRAQQATSAYRAVAPCFGGDALARFDASAPLGEPACC